MRDWIAANLRELYSPPQDLYEAIGVARVEKDANGGIIRSWLVGGVLYDHYHELAPGQWDCMLTAAGEPGWLTRGAIRELLSYPFNDLKCIRLTSIISKPNKAARALNERLGFKIEGTIRNGRGLGKDTILYGLLRADAERWLK